MEEAKKTPLYEKHLSLGGRVINFGGWFLPVEYKGMAVEHKTVREKVGLFDVSHMGEIIVQGSDSLALVQKLVTNDAANLQIHQALYSPMCYPNGGIVDDILVYKMADQDYLLVVNGANIQKDLAWIIENSLGDVAIENISPHTAQLALQGPKALAVLKKLTAYPVEEIKYYWFQPEVEVAGVLCLVSRTGYTGEDGFELYCAAREAERLWDALLKAGAEAGLVPAGLGARDTLRFEAGLPLYSQELGPDITPLEAGLGTRFVNFNKGEFLGREALLTQKEQGIPRKLVGIELIDKGIPRNGYSVLLDDKEIGQITSGTQSPTLGKNLGMALIKSEYGVVGTEVLIRVRQRQLKARVIARPFYQREVE